MSGLLFGPTESYAVGTGRSDQTPQSAIVLASGYPPGEIVMLFLEAGARPRTCTSVIAKVGLIRRSMALVAKRVCAQEYDKKPLSSAVAATPAR